MNINIQIADVVHFFHNGLEIVVIPKGKVASYLKSKAYRLLTELAEIHSAIERQESICFFSDSLIVTSCDPSQ